MYKVKLIKKLSDQKIKSQTVVFWDWDERQYFFERNWVGPVSCESHFLKNPIVFATAITT